MARHCIFILTAACLAVAGSQAAVIVSDEMRATFARETESASPESAIRLDPVLEQQLNKAAREASKATRIAIGKFKEGDFVAAITEAEQQAAKGDKLANYLLGIAYESGGGVNPSRKNALSYYRSAADLGHEESQFRAALLLLASDSQREKEEAKQRLEKAAQSNSALAGRVLGEAYLRGLLGDQPDVNRALKWWKRAANDGDVSSILLIASLYDGRFGYPEHQSATKAMEYYRKAAAMGDPSAKVALGVRLLRGTDEVRDTTSGYSWLMSAIEDKAYVAYLILGDYEANKDTAKAIDYYRKGSDVGHRECTLRLADAYATGYGVDQDIEAAANLWRQAAEEGSPVAQFRLAMQVFQTEEPDFTKGYVLLLAAANNGLAAAQNELGAFYLSGALGLADPAAGVAWLTRAAKAGNANAQNNLAALYQVGAAGLKTDMANATELYELAAKQGHVSSAVTLAKIYSSGGTVQEDLPKALALSKLAAELGNEQAGKLVIDVNKRCSVEQREKAEKMLRELRALAGVQ